MPFKRVEEGEVEPDVADAEGHMPVKRGVEPGEIEAEDTEGDDTEGNAVKLRG